MQETANKKMFRSKLGLLSKMFFFLGVLFVVSGSALVFLSFQNEVLEDGIIVTEVTEHKNVQKPQLEDGELAVTKEIDYKSKGIYHLTYINYAKQGNYKQLLTENSYFTIIDIIGKSYTLEKTIIVNGVQYSLENREIKTTDGILITYENNVLLIDIPDKLVTKNNIIEAKIKLVSRELNTNHITSQDTYYNFIPSPSNDFYLKKTSQAYIIEGLAYIKLTEK